MSFLRKLRSMASRKQGRPGVEPERPNPRAQDSEIIAALKPTIQRCWDLREPYARLWMYCVAFLRGDHWTDMDASARSSARRTDQLPSIIADARTTDNHLPIYYNAHVTAFRQSMPVLTAVAPSGEELDKLAAELGSRLLELREDPDHGNERSLRMQAVRQMLLFGEVLMRSQWSADAASGRGDVLAEVVDVFGYLKDPYSIGKWPPRFLIELDVRHVDEIHELYGEWVDPERGLIERTQYYDTIATQAGWRQEQGSRPPMEGAAIVYRSFFSPCKAYPEGMCYHLVGDRLLRRHTLQAGRWPFSRAAWEESELNLYPVGLIERLLQDQIRRNTLMSLGFSTAIVKARGDFFQIGPDRKPRVDVYNKQTSAQRILVPPQTTILPRDTGMDFRDAALQLQIHDNNMHDKANLPKPALGQPLEKERTLGAQEMAAETSQTASMEKVEEFGEQLLVPNAKQQLSLYAQYVVEPREIHMGPGQGVFPFTGRHLQGIKDVQAQAEPYTSPADKRRMVVIAKANGWMPPYASARDEASARQAMIQNGMRELEAEIEAQSVPLEEVLEEAKRERRMAYQAQQLQQAVMIVEAEVAIEQLQNPAPPAEEEQDPRAAIMRELTGEEAPEMAGAVR